MNPDHAREILRSLADGCDPVTGEQFPPDSPYQQADTVRALFMALDALEGGGRNRVPRTLDPDKPKAGLSRRSAAAAKAGGPWSPEEEQQLRDAIAAHKTETETLPFEAREASFADWRSRVAAAHGRTPGAITARLVKLGLLDATATNSLGRGDVPGAESSRPRPAVVPAVTAMQPVDSPPRQVPPPDRPNRPIPSPRPPSPSSLLPPELTQAEKDNLPF